MVDPKVYELAEYFMDDYYDRSEKHTMALAEAIQGAIETFPFPSMKEDVS